jgi:hypothetical protein
MTKTELFQLVQIQRPPPNSIIISISQEHNHETITVT